MSLADLYPWLKSLHVAAALSFIGGVLSVSIFLAAAPADTSTLRPWAQALRRWDQAVTTPAMLLVWAFGVTLAIGGNWWSGGWLQAKIAVVLILSGLHGVVSGRLRRLAGGTVVPTIRMAPLVIACAIVIALLATVKPF